MAKVAKTELFAERYLGNLVFANQGFSTGKRFYVSSATGSDAAGQGGSPTAPFASVDYAIGKCTTLQGDIIYVMPGHSEAYTAANGWDADVAGISIIGLGRGDNRPHFHFDDTDATVAIGAAGVTVKNLRFLAGIAAVVIGVDVEAAATGAIIENCDWYWSGTTTYCFVLGLQFNAGASRGAVRNCRFLGEPATAGCTAAIAITGAVHNLEISKCEFMGDYGEACVQQDTTLSQGLMFLDNLVYNTNADEEYLKVLTGTTGVIANTRGLASATHISDNAMADSMAHCQNLVVNSAGTYAIIKGVGGTVVADADAA
jgi:hypothetical protein